MKSMLAKISTGRTIKLNLKEEEEMLELMECHAVYMVEGMESCPDMVFYSGGPQYWAELMEMGDGTYMVNELRRIEQG